MTRALRVARRLGRVMIYRRVGSTLVAVGLALGAAAAGTRGHPFLAAGLMLLILPLAMIGELLGMLACHRGTTAWERDLVNALRFLTDFGDGTALRMIAAEEPERTRRWLRELSHGPERDRHTRAARAGLQLLESGAEIGR
jgi:hypothetical protein